MSTNQLAPRSRRAPWVLAIIGTVMIALAFFGLRALRAIGVSVDASPAVIGGIFFQLIDVGILCLIVGLVLALKGKPAWLIGCGAVLLCVGSGPFLVVGLMATLGLSADRNPNPIASGMLASVTFAPSLILLISGLILAYRKARRLPDRRRDGENGNGQGVVTG